MLYVPVVDKNNKPLMPTTANRAASWIRSRKATPFWKQGLFCVRLNVDPSDNKKQEISCGIDPGSKKEAFTIKVDGKTLINIQTDAKTGIKEKMETRRNARRFRRARKTPYRKCRYNRKRQKGFIPPSTRARWGWKLTIIRWLRKVYPISTYVVEDIQARTKPGKKKWNLSFSPLQVGKTYFYKEIENIGQLILKQGHDTKTLRDQLNLPKSKDKMGETFDSHCVDSWVLANVPFANTLVEDKSMVFLKPFAFYKRHLHVFNAVAGGYRKPQGGTRSLGFKRGSLIKHTKYGVATVGGTSNGRITLNRVEDGKRLTQKAKIDDCKFLCFSFAKIRVVSS